MLEEEDTSFGADAASMPPVPLYGAARFSTSLYVFSADANRYITANNIVAFERIAVAA